MKKKLTLKEQQTRRASELLDKKTSELIDDLHIEPDDGVLDDIYKELEDRYPDTVITANHEKFTNFQEKTQNRLDKFTNFQEKTQNRLDKIEERISRIDNHFLILNKLEKLIKIVDNKRRL